MKRWLPWLAVVAAILAVGLLARGGDDTGEPLDPRSTGPLGAKALVLLLEEMGADVRIAAAPTAGAGVAVVLVDELGEHQEDELKKWVDDGGVLVVADPLSSFVPALRASGGGLFGLEEDDTDVLRPACGLQALRDVRSIRVPGAWPYRVSPGSTACFALPGGGAYLVARSEGRGTVIALGGGAPFTNERLDERDNAVFAVALLAPRPGAAVTVLEAGAAGSGDDSLLDLVPGGAKAALWQFAAAFVALVLWRARRLGRPVVETQPVDVPGSELVLATGNLLQQARSRDAAGAMLRMQLHRDLASRMGLPPDVPVDQLAAAVSNAGIDPVELTNALTPSIVVDDRALVSLAQTIESIRREVAHV